MPHSYGLHSSSLCKRKEITDLRPPEAANRIQPITLYDTETLHHRDLTL